MRSAGSGTVVICLLQTVSSHSSSLRGVRVGLNEAILPQNMGTTSYPMPSFLGKQKRPRSLGARPQLQWCFRLADGGKTPMCQHGGEGCSRLTATPSAAQDGRARFCTGPTSQTKAHTSTVTAPDDDAWPATPTPRCWAWSATPGPALARRLARSSSCRCSGQGMTRNGALAGIIVGAVTVLVWKQFGWLGLYEIVPGFILCGLTVWLVSRLG